MQTITHLNQCPRCRLPVIYHDSEQWTLPLDPTWSVAIHAAQPHRPMARLDLAPSDNDNDNATLFDHIPIQALVAAHRCGPQPPTTGQADHLPPY